METAPCLLPSRAPREKLQSPSVPLSQTNPPNSSPPRGRTLQNKTHISHRIKDQRGACQTGRRGIFCPMHVQILLLCCCKKSDTKYKFLENTRSREAEEHQSGCKSQRVSAPWRPQDQQGGPCEGDHLLRSTFPPKLGLPSC